MNRIRAMNIAATDKHINSPPPTSGESAQVLFTKTNSAPTIGLSVVWDTHIFKSLKPGNEWFNATGNLFTVGQEFPNCAGLYLACVSPPPPPPPPKISQKSYVSNMLFLLFFSILLSLVVCDFISSSVVWKGNVFF